MLFPCPKNWDCIHLNTTHFSKWFWFISPSFSYREDLDICWTLIILFWILPQTYLLNFLFSLYFCMNAFFARRSNVSRLDPVPLIKRCFFSFCLHTPIWLNKCLCLNFTTDVVFCNFASVFIACFPSHSLASWEGVPISPRSFIIYIGTRESRIFFFFYYCCSNAFVEPNERTRAT